MSHKSDDLDGKLIEKPELRNKINVFFDRDHAGVILSEMLTNFKNTNTIVFGIPAGGVPVAAPVARELDLPLYVAVVSKVTLPWNTEAGYGAVAFNGTIQLNENMISQMSLTKDVIDEGIRKASSKVTRRFKEFRGDKPFPDLENLTAIIVDDGIASGYTMLVAVEALREEGVDDIIIAVPTGHLEALERVEPSVDTIYCANVRGGWGFAVADAYQNWYDVNDNEVAEILEKFK